jgi:hypothetical protein
MLVRGGRQGADMVPGGDDVRGTGPAGLDVEVALASAASQPAGGMQDAVAQCLRLGVGELPSRASRRSQASRPATVRTAVWQALFIASEPETPTPTGTSPTPTGTSLTPTPNDISPTPTGTDRRRAYSYTCRHPLPGDRLRIPPTPG